MARSAQPMQGHEAQGCHPPEIAVERPDLGTVVGGDGRNDEIRDTETAKSVLALMEALDDHDDVQSVSANFTIPDDALAALQ